MEERENSDKLIIYNVQNDIVKEVERRGKNILQMEFLNIGSKFH